VPAVWLFLVWQSLLGPKTPFLSDNLAVWDEKKGIHSDGGSPNSDNPQRGYVA
jgi:hypothetical protein